MALLNLYFEGRQSKASGKDRGRLRAAVMRGRGLVQSNAAAMFVPRLRIGSSCWRCSAVSIARISFCALARCTIISAMSLPWASASLRTSFSLNVSLWTNPLSCLRFSVS